MQRDQPAPFSEQITFVAVADLERSRRFYVELLGMQPVEDQGDCLIMCIAGDAFFGICARPQGADPRGVGVIVTLVTDDVDGWHQRLTEAGVECTTPPTGHPKYAIYQAFYRDPDGYTIEIQRFDDADWRVPG